MAAPRFFTPRTTLVGGITHLGDAMPGATPRRKRTLNQTPKATPMSTPKVQIPAKRTPRTQRVVHDEDYSTPYVPLALAEHTVSAINKIVDEIQIDDCVPMPPKVAGTSKQEIARALLLRLGVGQSARLHNDYQGALLKMVREAHAANNGRRYAVKKRHDDEQTLRVWRVA